MFPRPLLFSAAASSLPLTEDLRGEEDLAGFVLPSGGHGHRPQPQQPQQQQPHHRRQMPPQPLFTVVTSPPANGAPGTAVASPKKQRGGGGQCGRRGCDGGGGGGGCHLFVGNVPHSAHREQIADSFARFGRVTEVILFQKDGGGNGGIHFPSALKIFDCNMNFQAALPLTSASWSSLTPPPPTPPWQPKTRYSLPRRGLGLEATSRGLRSRSLASTWSGGGTTGQTRLTGWQPGTGSSRGGRVCNSSRRAPGVSSSNSRCLRRSPRQRSSSSRGAPPLPPRDRGRPGAEID